MSTGDKKIPDATPQTPWQAYNAGRAAAQKLHSYKTSGFGAGGDCNHCKQDYLDIGAHVEAVAEAAGQAARNARIAEIAEAFRQNEIDEAKKKAEEIRKNPGGMSIP